MKLRLFKFGTCLANLALMVTALNANTTCMMFVHQSELPDLSKKLRKF